MGTNISTVDYKQIPSKARQMQSEGQALNSELTSAYNSIGQMSKSWYGKRYNELVKSFNNIINSLNDMLKLVITDIPDTLNTVAKNYASADGDSVSSISSASPKRITNIANSTATGMRFIESEVNTTKLNVEKNFANAKQKMENIKTIYNGITWQGDAATAFKSKFNQLKSQIDQSLDDLKRQFSQLMQQTISDMQATEKANTVS